MGLQLEKLLTTQKVDINSFREIYTNINRTKNLDKIKSPKLLMELLNRPSVSGISLISSKSGDDFEDESVGVILLLSKLDIIVDKNYTMGSIIEIPQFGNVRLGKYTTEIIKKLEDTTLIGNHQHKASIKSNPRVGLYRAKAIFIPCVTF